MTDVREVTAKEMVEFIMSQPDEKLIDYSECDTDGSCGCLMVQYGKFAGIEFDCAGRHSWISSKGLTARAVATFADGFRFNDFGHRYFCRTNVTFGETKKYCRSAFPEFC